MLTETLRRILVSPQFGTDDYRLWLEQADFLEFLEANKTEEEVVLYAGTKEARQNSLAISRLNVL